MKNNQKGFAEIAIVAIVVILILAVAALLYFRNASSEPVLEEAGMEEIKDQDPNPATPEPLSQSNDISTLEEELNATVTGSVESDINSMNSEANSL